MIFSRDDDERKSESESALLNDVEVFDSSSSVARPEDVAALLRLAAEHDRVDVIHELLGVGVGVGVRPNTAAMNGVNDRSLVPPLHAAVASGSVDAAACLLRWGADPSIRPRIDDPRSDDRSFDGASAYELLRRRNLSAGKRRGVAHAFFAEALRAVGADDAARLECLLRSGMTARGDDDDTTNGERSLLEWARDLTVNREPGGCYHLLESWRDGEIVSEQQLGQEGQENIKENRFRCLCQCLCGC